MNHLTAVLELMSVGGINMNTVPGKISIHQGDDVRIRFWVRDLCDRTFSIGGHTVSAKLGSIEFPAVLTAPAAGQGEFSIIGSQSEQLSTGNLDLILTITKILTNERTRVVLKNAVEVKAL